jgi:MFS family permease
LKNRQALILLFTANAISGFAQGVSMLAIPWYFARLDLSSQFNLLFGAVTFGNIFWGLFAGTLVDRFNRKQLFLTTNMVEGSVLLLVALSGWLIGSLPLSMIMVVFTITVFGYRMHYPNLYAFAQEITSKEHYTRVTSYIEIVGQATNVIAGALAVVLLEGVDMDLPLIGQINIEAWEIYEIFTLDAVTYFVSVALIKLIQYTPDKVFEVDKGRLSDRLKTGIIFLLEHKLIFLFGFFSHSIFVIMLVSLFTVMPMYITNVLHAGGVVFGSMEMLYGIGALSAGLFIGGLPAWAKRESSRWIGQNISWATRSTRITAIIVMMFMTTLLLILCGFIYMIPYYFITGMLVGFSNAGTRILRVSYLFEHIPNQVIGRVNSVFSVLNILMRVIFVFLFSLAFFAESTNIIFAYFILGGFTLVSGLVLCAYYKKLRVL